MESIHKKLIGLTNGNVQTYLFIDKLDSNEAFECIGWQERKLSVSVLDYSTSVNRDERRLWRSTGRLCQTECFFFPGNSFPEEDHSLKNLKFKSNVSLKVLKLQIYSTKNFNFTEMI